MKFIKILLLYIFGYVDIKIEGFFTERFINLAIAKNIFLWRLSRHKSTEVEARIAIKDFKKLPKIAKKTKCRVEIKTKKGLPFLLHRYKKRKIFAITFLVIAILIFGLTKFAWNIDILCDESIDKTKVLKILNEVGIKEGTPLNKIDTSKAINYICMKMNDVSWVGIKISGTNVIVSLEKATAKPEIIDNSIACNIVSDKEGVITKVTARNGTIAVNVRRYC